MVAGSFPSTGHPLRKKDTPTAIKFLLLPQAAMEENSPTAPLHAYG